MAADMSTSIVPTPTQQIIVHQDNSTFPTGVILDETNYSLWSQLMKMRIGLGTKLDISREKQKNQKLEIPILEHGLLKITE